MSWLTATADELDAVARRLGAGRFPGVRRSVFDSVPPELHPLLTGRFVATLAARGLVVEHAGQVVLAPGAAALLDPVVTGTVRYVVDHEDAADAWSCVVAVGRRGDVVQHRVSGDLHRFDPLGTDVDAALALVGVPVAPAGAVARAVPGRRLAAQLPPPELWRSLTVVRRIEAMADDATVFSWRVTVDLGDGDVRTVEPAADDDTLDPDAEALFTLSHRRRDQSGNPSHIA